MATTQHRMKQGSTKLKHDVRAAKETAQYIKRDDELRTNLEQRVNSYFDLPLAMASIAMLLLTLIQLGGMVAPDWRARITLIQTALWALFFIHYAMMLALAPVKQRYIKRHWLDTLVVVVPFLGWLRILAVLRAVPVLPLFRLAVFGSAGLSAPMVILKRRKLGKLMLVSIMVILITAGLEFLLEKGQPGSQIHTFGDALWWSATLVATIGSEIYPVTPWGRVVAFVLMLFGIGVFSYVTASVASLLVGLDQESGTTQAPQTTARLSPDDLTALQSMVRAAVAEALTSPDVRRLLVEGGDGHDLQRRVNDVLLNSAGEQIPSGSHVAPAGGDHSR